MNDAAVLLVVDPTLGLQTGGDPTQGMAAFYSQSIQLGEHGILQQQYRPIDVALASGTPERLIVQDLAGQLGSTAKAPAPLQNLDALARSIVVCDSGSSYYSNSCDDVCSPR